MNKVFPFVVHQTTKMIGRSKFGRFFYLVFISDKTTDHQKGHCAKIIILEICQATPSISFQVHFYCSDHHYNKGCCPVAQHQSKKCPFDFKARRLYFQCSRSKCKKVFSHEKWNSDAVWNLRIRDGQIQHSRPPKETIIFKSENPIFQNSCKNPIEFNYKL